MLVATVFCARVSFLGQAMINRALQRESHRDASDFLAAIQPQVIPIKRHFLVFLTYSKLKTDAASEGQRYDQATEQRAHARDTNSYS